MFLNLHEIPRIFPVFWREPPPRTTRVFVATFLGQFFLQNTPQRPRKWIFVWRVNCGEYFFRKLTKQNWPEHIWVVSFSICIYLIYLIYYICIASLCRKQFNYSEPQPTSKTHQESSKNHLKSSPCTQQQVPFVPGCHEVTSRQGVEVELGGGWKNHREKWWENP